MRKFYLFLAGAFLALPMVAQNEPIRNPETDPKLIYLQDFESDWEAWSTARVDTIDGLDYYLVDAVSTSKLKIWEDKNYQTGFMHRDTLIEIFNGVKQTGSATDIKNGAFDGDSYTILSDPEDDFSRQKALVLKTRFPVCLEVIVREDAFAFGTLELKGLAVIKEPCIETVLFDTVPAHGAAKAGDVKGAWDRRRIDLVSVFRRRALQKLFFVARQCDGTGNDRNHDHGKQD